MGPEHVDHLSKKNIQTSFPSKVCACMLSQLPLLLHYISGVYVANLTQHEVRSAGDVFALLEIGKQHLVIAETKMVRHSSR